MATTNDRHLNAIIGYENELYLDQLILFPCNKAELQLIVDHYYQYFPPSKIARGLIKLGRPNDMPARYKQDYGDRA